MTYRVQPLLMILAPLLILAARGATSAQPVQVSIKTQPEAPLLITVVAVRLTDPRAPEFEYQVFNRSEKPISAFTVPIKDGGLSGSTMSLLMFSLQPGASQYQAYGNTTFGEPIKVIELSLDFVEFADGGVWGLDVAQSADRLRGTRAGMEAQRDRLLKALTEGGEAGFVETLNANRPIPTPTLGQSEKWQHNFQTGVRAFRTRIEKVNREGGFSAVETELQQPYYLRAR